MSDKLRTALKGGGRIIISVDRWAKGVPLQARPNGGGADGAATGLYAVPFEKFNTPSPLAEFGLNHPPIKHLDFCIGYALINRRRGGRCNWWEASAQRQSATNVCIVNNNGNANNNVATNGGIYAPL